MTATNIDLAEFINVLTQLHEQGTRLINMDMVPDSNSPTMNKLIIHPVNRNKDNYENTASENNSKLLVKNPRISTDNNDIFNTFNEIL